MKQKGSSDVKGSLWNHLDKKVILWHREAPLFLRVYRFKIVTRNNKKQEIKNSYDTVFEIKSLHSYDRKHWI